MKPPKAKKINTLLEKHGHQRIDPYFWLNQRDHPEVLAYLKAENDYADETLKPTEKLQEVLYEEMKARYKKDDQSLPYFFNGYYYLVEYQKGKEYPLFYRKKQNLENPKELVLDANELIKNNAYLDVGSISVSMNNEFACFSTDYKGDNVYALQFIDLKTNKTLQDYIPNTSGKAVWANDNQHIFYVTKDKNVRDYRVYLHQIGSPNSLDQLIFEEVDETFDVSVYKSKSLEYIFISSSSSTMDEHRFVPSDSIFEPWKILQPRTPNLEYAVEHYQDEFYIITNAHHATNFKIVKTKVDHSEIDFWEDFIPYKDSVLLEGFEVFKDFFVVEEREAGLLRTKIINLVNQEEYYLPFTDPTYTAYIGINLEFETHVLRFGYTSLTTPSSTYEFNMSTKTTTLLKQQVILDETFHPDHYISERIWAPSRDGKKFIPISLVYHKDTPKSTDTPLLLYGYGSYGSTVDAGFSSIRLSLLNRGFIYAIAHVRGGEYLGRDWYEEGKLMHKKNTFYDFIDAAQYLCKEKYTSPKHLYALGGSAGGLLMGAVINMEPQLFHGVIAEVPFVDVITTMLDPSIPLTTGEYEEWGDPNQKEEYEYILSYSPYDNVEAKEYPNLLITTGYNDAQVQYWEPAKWTAKLRDMKTDENLLIFKIDMNTGHAGASGRFESLKEEALEYAFLLMLENKMK